MNSEKAGCSYSPGPIQLLLFLDYLVSLPSTLAKNEDGNISISYHVVEMVASNRASSRHNLLARGFMLSTTVRFSPSKISVSHKSLELILLYPIHT